MRALILVIISGTRLSGSKRTVNICIRNEEGLAPRDSDFVNAIQIYVNIAQRGKIFFKRMDTCGESPSAGSILVQGKRGRGVNPERPWPRRGKTRSHMCTV